jgi:RsiW-degrading membrane proteinase PrsW (M82 family)
VALSAKNLWKNKVWTWHWSIFLLAIIPGYCLVGFARGVVNESNIKKPGEQGDYRIGFQTEPAAIILRTLLAGAILAAIATLTTGFLF